MTFDRSGRLFFTNDNILLVYPAFASGNATPIATMRYSAGGPSVAVDAADNVYLLLSDSFSQSIASYAFDGKSFHKRWTVQAPPYPHWFGVLE